MEQLIYLKQLCSEWNKSSEGFARIVAATIQTLGLYQRELASEFEVAESTVSRWANGVARPHPRAQKLIVATIEKRVQNTLRARERVYAQSAYPHAAKQR
jgi:DNA-binding transcriptional regulator YiaG